MCVFNEQQNKAHLCVCLCVCPGAESGGSGAGEGWKHDDMKAARKHVGRMDVRYVAARGRYGGTEGHYATQHDTTRHGMSHMPSPG